MIPKWFWQWPTHSGIVGELNQPRLDDVDWPSRKILLDVDGCYHRFPRKRIAPSALARGVIKQLIYDDALDHFNAIRLVLECCLFLM